MGLINAIVTKPYQPLPPGVNPELAQLVDLMLRKDPQERPTIEQVLAEPLVHDAFDAWLAERRAASPVSAGSPTPKSMHANRRFSFGDHLTPVEDHSRRLELQCEHVRESLLQFFPEGSGDFDTLLSFFSNRLTGNEQPDKGLCLPLPPDVEGVKKRLDSSCDIAREVTIGVEQLAYLKHMQNPRPPSELGSVQGAS